MAAEARELHVRLIRFYARLKEQDEKWKDLLKQAEKPLESLGEQAEQYRQIRSVELKEVEETIGEEAWNRLQYKVQMCLEEEFMLLMDIMIKLQNIRKDIKSHLWELQIARCEVNVEAETMQELVNGTSHRPNLTNLLVWAMDAHQHYNKMCSRICKDLDNLDYNVEDSIEDLEVAFMDDKSGRNHIQEILAFTRFLAEEPLPQASENVDPTKQRKGKN